MSRRIWIAGLAGVLAFVAVTVLAGRDTDDRRLQPPPPTTTSTISEMAARFCPHLVDADQRMAAALDQLERGGPPARTAISELVTEVEGLLSAVPPPELVTPLGTMRDGFERLSQELEGAGYDWAAFGPDGPLVYQDPAFADAADTLDRFRHDLCGNNAPVRG